MKNILLVIISALALSCSGSNTVIDLGYGDYSQNNFLLMLGANSTVRASDIRLDVINPSKAVYTVKKAITVYDKEDKDDVVLVLYYRDFISVDYLKANLFDKHGNHIRSYSLDDATDFSTSRGATFFTDSRAYVLEPSYSSFPFTVEFEYQQTFSGLLYLPTWYPQEEYGQSVESSTFRIVDRQNNGVRFFSKNLDTEPEVSYDSGSRMLTWSISNLLPVKREQAGPSFSELMPQVRIAPNVFELEGSNGDASSWNSFGHWYYDLGKETRELPEEAKQEIEILLSGVVSEQEKVHILFEYLQEKSRYVSIQLGLGGWKPYSAEYVFNNSYGDCKALTNYMQAILEYAGIKSQPVLINSGFNEPEMEIAFPSQQFNHVILRVELDNGDIIWLECTSKYLPPNHLGSNHGKSALLVTSEGGEVIKTPELSYEKNASHRLLSFEVLENGNAYVKTSVIEKGIPQDFLLMEILPVSEKEREDWLHESLEADNSKITEYDFSGITDSDEFAQYLYEAELGDYVRTSSKRIYIPINKMNRWRFSPAEDENRSTPFHLRYSFVESDSVIFSTPEGYVLESAPENISVKYDFGEFRFSFEKENDQKYFLKRYFSFKKNIIEPEEYSSLKQFFDKVKYTDQQQVVLVKREES